MHPLYGPRERVKRANQQIIALQGSFQEFFKDNLYEIGVAEYSPEAMNYSLRVRGGPQEFPVDWPLLIGEIAHNLRAALDGLAWQLALRTTTKPYDRTAFPIYRLGKTTRKRSGSPLPHFWGKSHGLRLMRSIPKPLWARIESFQPYKRGNGGRHSPLFLLEKLNNTDKHRLLTVLMVSPAAMQSTGISGGTRFRIGVPLRPNAKVGSVKDVPPPSDGGGAIYVFNPATGELEHPKMQVNVTVAPGVRFGDSCEAVERLPVIGTLQRIANETSRIIESFAGEFLEAPSRP